jgi:hypothetical protein
VLCSNQLSYITKKQARQKQAGSYAASFPGCQAKFRPPSQPVAHPDKAIPTRAKPSQTAIPARAIDRHLSFHVDPTIAFQQNPATFHTAISAHRSLR